MNFTQTKNEILDKIKSEAVSGFHYETIRRHWNNVIGLAQLAPDETIRLVVMPKEGSKLAERSKMSSGTGSWTDSAQIRNADQLIDRLIELQGTDTPGSVGFALSAGVYRVDPNVKSPSFNQLKGIQTMIIDLDAHEREGDKTRFNVSTYEPEYLRYMSTLSLNYINGLLKANGLPVISPAFINVTGGGFQVGVKFDKPMDAKIGRRVFETIGAILGEPVVTKQDLLDKKKRGEEATKSAGINNELVSRMGVQAEGQEQKVLTAKDYKANVNEMDQKSQELLQTIKKKKGLCAYVKDPLTGNWYAPFIEVDNSFKDVTHAQRIPGTINQKYNAYAYIDDFALDYGILELSIQSCINDIGTSHNTVDQKMKYKNHFKSVPEIYTAEVLKHNPKGLPTTQPVDFINTMAPIIQTANNHDRKQGLNPGDITGLEQEFLKKIEGDQVDELMTQHLGISLVKQTERYSAYSSPFREDNNPSLAVYKNNNFTSIVDFTENKTYTIITLWMAVCECNKTDAINQISQQIGIDLGRIERKDFQHLQTEEDVTTLVRQVDTKKFIYYRLANKKKDCKWRNIETGEVHNFDGDEMLSEHVLKEQLNYKYPEDGVRKEFQKVFNNHVLINAFEIFRPGEPTNFKDGYVRFVNKWVPSKNYKDCYAIAADLSPMSIEDSIATIKEQAPTMYLYLLQLTQCGSLPYFVNWLAAIAKFKIMPTIPIFSSVEGTGKNLFVTQVLEFYLNEQYVNVVNGKQMQNNFNSFMGETNLIVADEGNFTGTQEFDQLKLLTGNDRITVEKKGIDAVVVKKQFNIMMFTNGECPVRHSNTDRRCNYYRLDHNLVTTLNKLDYPLDKFIEDVKEQVSMFWAILIKTKNKKSWNQMNLKNGQYNKQILLMHPFGKLVLKMIAGDWKEITLQLNEKVRDEQDIKQNLGLLRNIKSAFYSGEGIQLTLINKYLEAFSWKSNQSIQGFITDNSLHKHGVEIDITGDDVKIKMDIEKLQALVRQENNLAEKIPEFSIGPVKSINQIRKENNDNQAQIVNKTNPSTVAHAVPNVRAVSSNAPTVIPGVGTNLPGMTSGVTPPVPGGAPSGAVPGAGLPGGAP